MIMLIKTWDLSTCCKEQVMGDLRVLKHQGLQAGVYIFRNKVNLKSYVGSSVHLYNRIADYYYNNESHGKISIIISRALAKYTHSNFKLLVFLVSSTDSKYILFMEQLVIDILQPEYNILSVAGSPIGFKHSLESKEKIRQIAFKRGWKGETHPSFNTGKPVYLIEVLPEGLNLTATFSNIRCCSTTLAINRNTVSRRIASKKVFKYNGSSHILSFDLPHLLDP
jgi:excinuclease UvrABC nuclease subunit